MKGFVVSAAPLGCRAPFLLVRTLPASRQGLRKPYRNPGHLRYPRLHSAGPQAARQGVGRPSDCRRRSPVGDARSIVTVPDRQAIALRCDPEGIVERLLVDEIGASRHIGPGRSFVNAVDLSSKDEAHNVLSTIARELVAFDREIRLRGSDPGLAVILHVAGLAMPANRILVVGARSIVELIFLCRPPTGPSGPRAKTRSERISRRRIIW